MYLPIWKKSKIPYIHITLDDQRCKVNRKGCKRREEEKFKVNDIESFNDDVDPKRRSVM